MEETKQLLKDWDLADLFPAFEANEVTVEMFNDLSTDFIKELIPKIGNRIKFVKKLEIWNASFIVQPDAVLVTADDFNAFSPTSTSSTLSNSSNYSLPSKSSVLSEDLNDTDEPPTKLTAMSQKPFLIIDGVDLIPEPPTKKQKFSYLKDLLNASNMGKSLLEVYKSAGFKQLHRQQLADIIISKELEGEPDKRLKSDRLQELAEMIVDLFPTEYKETHFTKVTTIKNGKVIKTGKGKLFCKYYSLRRSFVTSGLIKKPESEKTENITVELDDGELHVDTIMWLKNCVDPWTTVESNWSKTTAVRHKELQQPGKLCDYFNSYPALRSNKGYLLLEIDFGNLYPDHCMKLYNTWEIVSKKLIKLQESLPNQDSHVKEVLKTLNSDTVTQDTIVSNVMVLLTYILPTISVAKTKQHGRWRPSKIEVQEAFWLHLKTISELKQVVENKKEKLRSYGLTLQPLVIVVGPSLAEIHTVYVRIDDNLYEIESPLKALDVCFKSFHALHAEYPAEAVQIWCFIQRAMYNLQTKWDKSFTGVNSLLSDLNRLDE